jgi:hypothetical protein
VNQLDKLHIGTRLFQYKFLILQQSEIQIQF